MTSCDSYISILALVDVPASLLVVALPLTSISLKSSAIFKVDELASALQHEVLDDVMEQ